MPTPLHLPNLDVLIHLPRRFLAAQRPERPLPAQKHRPHFDLPLLLQPLLVINLILLKGSVDVEPGPHRPRRGILRGVKVQILLGVGGRVHGQAVVEVLDVLLLVARDEEFGEVGDGVEGEMPEARGKLVRVVDAGAGEGAFAPDEGGAGRGEEMGVGVGDHAADVVADDVHGVLDAQLGGQQGVQVGRQDFLGVACRGPGGVAGTAVVGGDDVVAGGGKGRDHMAELVGGLREAVDEEDGTLLRRAGWGFGFDVVDPDIFWFLLEPHLTMGQLGVGCCHCSGGLFMPFVTMCD